MKEDRFRLRGDVDGGEGGIGTSDVTTGGTIGGTTEGTVDLLKAA